MNALEKATLDYLVMSYRGAVATAGYANARGCARPDLVKSPWSYIPDWQAEAILAAVDAGLWPDDAPLADIPDSKPFLSEPERRAQMMVILRAILKDHIQTRLPNEA